MKYDTICPNIVTFICIMKWCGVMESLEMGQGIDADGCLIRCMEYTMHLQH